MYTQHNNQSMKTVVETFIIEETQELIYDNEKLDQWNKRVSEMGLEGQTKIVTPTKSPVPFLHMKTTLVNTFEVLCPRTVDIKKYDKTPIPVELLDLVALSLKENYFQNIQVWYDDETPDPCIVGIRKSSEYDERYPSWPRGLDKYLIGRWADVKMSLDELVEKAKNLFAQRKRAEYENCMRKYKRLLEDVESEANAHFGFTTQKDPLIDLPF